MSHAVSQPTYRAMATYFLPLAFQSAAQSVTYPLVAMIASRGPGGSLDLAGLAQGQSVMFLLGTLGAGMITAGMIHGRTAEGYRAYSRLNLLLALSICSLQALAFIPAVGDAIFLRIMGLPGPVAAVASQTLWAAIPLHLAFFMRNPSMALLYNAGQTTRAGLATAIRILVTLSATPVLVHYGWVGPMWALAALTVPVALESVLSMIFAAPLRRDILGHHAKKTKRGIGKRFRGWRHSAVGFLRGARRQVDETLSLPARKREILIFSIPLSVGAFFMTFTGLILGAVVARAPHPELSLPAWVLAAGVVNAMGFAALRNQTLIIHFPPGDIGFTNQAKFAMASGLGLGLLPLLFLIPSLSQLYFNQLQNASPEIVALVHGCLLILVLQPLALALRAYQEGRAALKRATMLMVVSQGILLAVLTIASALLLAFDVPGHLIPPIALVVANGLSALALALLLKWSRDEPKVVVAGPTGEG